MKLSRNLIMSTIVLSLFIGCKTSKNISNSGQAYNEKYRPQFHFSPPKNWMNDPNGLVYYEGEYHLFYQHYPDGNTWGPMHWGHAVSTDLLHWKNLPIALYPDSLGYIFSGSAVVDWKNTSGFGKEGHPPLVAIFTYHDMAGEKSGKTNFQNQGMAYSNDKGRTWTKYAGNPVLKNQGTKDFRDPKVIWYPETNTWIMALAVKNKISFYNSKNLIDWEHSSDFNTPWAAYGDVWECPDLFPLKTSNGDIKWVLLVSINTGGPNGGSATQYFIGKFDGEKFHTETNKIHWIDYGRDNYAGVTWSDIPESDGRRIFLGWMSNWNYAQNVPTQNWRSAMTIPRVLTLENINNDYFLRSAPIRELQSLRKSSRKYFTSEIELPSDIVEIETKLLPSDFQFVFSNNNNEKLILKKENNQLIFDRKASGVVNFSNDFVSLQTVPVQNIQLKDIRVYIDRSSIEIIFNNGELILTNIIFPTLPYNKLECAGIEKPVTVYQLKSIW